MSGKRDIDHRTHPPRRRMSVTTEGAVHDQAIRPFTVETSDADLEDLRARVTATRWPEKEPVSDASQGVPLETMQALARYWATEYDWRRCEERLKALPHFITEIDGLDIHFIHVRSKHEDALPLLVAHGWPGSVIEQLKIIGPLTDPTAHGASEADAFHLVIPSMPGYGFSGKPAVTGWGPEHIARAWAELMKRLAYDNYVASGGDWGGQIVDLMGAQAPAGLIGIHTNFPGAVRPDVAQAVQSGGPAPPDLSEEGTRLYEKLRDFFATDVAYALEMGTHPQTLYGIADSPIGLAAWMLDHDAASLALIARVFDGQSEGLTRDDVLDNITHYWLTNTGVSSGRLYRENKLGFFDPKGVSVPVAVSVFPDELYQVPRSWAEEAYPRLIHYNRLDKGGHFAAWEQPKLFASEVRAGLRSVR
ncbi:epoxide hydrolase family protein [Amycolatopsis sp. NPDC001319]|uniref:epoxide hydrolase family protein n=1 Tax=unclassified Amycolatopsis TaxID=2618356 RepID=UPI003694B851